MLRKILVLTVAVCAATLLMSADALAWGGGSWNRSGSASYTGRYGNSYSRSYSCSGSFSGDRYGGRGVYLLRGGVKGGGGVVARGLGTREVGGIVAAAGRLSFTRTLPL